MVVFLSAHSVNSPSVLFAVGAAVADRKRIIPVAVGDIDVQEVPSPLAQRQILRAASPAEAARQVAKIIEASSD